MLGVVQCAYLLAASIVVNAVITALMILLSMKAMRLSDAVRRAERLGRADASGLSGPGA